MRGSFEAAEAEKAQTVWAPLHVIVDPGYPFPRPNAAFDDEDA
jgi:hypothetical protein